MHWMTAALARIDQKWPRERLHFTPDSIERAHAEMLAEQAAERLLPCAVQMLAWVEHWQADAESNLAPTPESLATAHAMLKAAISTQTEINQSRRAFQ